jgi:16S rRNA C967 or C1407 C5-methylase (RsmB/RsmF family)
MSIPESFFQRLPLPESEMQAFRDSLREPPPTALRLNPFKAKLVAKLERVPWCKEGVYLEKRPVFTSDPAFHAGAYYPQEASSQVMDHVVRQLALDQEPISALDLCGAPGGKATLLRSVLHPDSFVWANEIVPKRAKVLFENLQKWGHEGIAVSRARPADFSDMKAAFDLILVDAPCSGEGLFRKQPGAVEEWSLDAVEACALRQREILRDIWPSLKPGGILVYSTCTFNQMENEDTLNRLAELGGVDFPEVAMPFQGVSPSRERGVTGYRFWPHRVKGEGFFLAVVRKAEGKMGKRKIGNRQHLRSVKISGLSLPCVADDRNVTYVLTDRGRKLWEQFPAKEKVISPGYEIGRVKSDRYLPGHGRAMWRSFRSREGAELSLGEALVYLSCHDVMWDRDGKGIIPVSFEAFDLGYARCDKSRLVSKYPLNFRIRKPSVEGYTKIVEALPFSDSV